MTETLENTNAVVPVPEIDPQQRKNAEKIVNKYIVLSGGVGLIPLPLLDQISIGALQGKMIYDLGQLYNIPIDKYQVKAIIASILGGAHSGWISSALVRYLTVIVPGVNVVGILVIRPVLAALVTYAIGKIFIKQFQAGHKLKDFDLQKVRKDFAKQMEAGVQFFTEKNKVPDSLM